MTGLGKSILPSTTYESSFISHLLLTSLGHPRVAAAVGELARGAVLGERVRDGGRRDRLDERRLPVRRHLLPRPPQRIPGQDAANARGITEDLMPPPGLIIARGVS